MGRIISLRHRIGIGFALAFAISSTACTNTNLLGSEAGLPAPKDAYFLSRPEIIFDRWWAMPTDEQLHSLLD